MVYMQKQLLNVGWNGKLKKKLNIFLDQVKI